MSKYLDRLAYVIVALACLVVAAAVVVGFVLAPWPIKAILVLVALMMWAFERVFP